MTDLGCDLEFVCNEAVPPRGRGPGIHMMVLKSHAGHFFVFCWVSVCSTPSLDLFSSTPSLAGTQQQQHHLHQQERGSAAAAPTPGMRRVQQTTLHVSSNISCDYCSGTCVSLFFNLRHPRDEPSLLSLCSLSWKKASVDPNIFLTASISRKSTPCRVCIP